MNHLLVGNSGRLVFSIGTLSYLTKSFYWRKNAVFFLFHHLKGRVEACWDGKVKGVSTVDLRQWCACVYVYVCEQGCEKAEVKFVLRHSLLYTHHKYCRPLHISSNTIVSEDTNLHSQYTTNRIREAWNPYLVNTTPSDRVQGGRQRVTD